MAEDSAQPPVNRRRIIERPRLTRLLDDSPARIKMLVAPAGYGKTTLARQWLSGKIATWFTCGPEAADVAGLAAGLATALSKLDSRAGVTLMERLTATDHPASEVDVLGEIIIEDLSTWSTDAWLVVDDYHHVNESPASELLFSQIASAPSLNLLVCSRYRPSWAAARRVVYGELFILSRSELAMRADEAQELFDSQPCGDDVLERAHGWPAVLSLAAVSGVTQWDKDLVPTTLYRFLAEEIFVSLTQSAQDALTLLAVAPHAEARVARALLAERYGSVISEAINAGMIDDAEDGASFYIHPLIRKFLLARVHSLEAEEQRTRATLVLDYLLDARRWDESFEVVSRFLPSEIERLVSSAMPDLLSQARTQTLENWVRFADEASVSGLAIDLARAELAFREGAFLEALAGAELLLKRMDNDAEQRGRVLVLAGRAAHLASREITALEWYRAAKDQARNEDDRRAGAWGELAAAIDLEQPNTQELLEQMTEEVRSHSDVISLVDKTLSYESRLGSLRTLSRARGLSASAERVADPLVRCSFRNGLAYGLALAGEYEESLALCDLLDEDARVSHLDFVRPFALATRAICLSAQRQHDGAIDVLRLATELAVAQRNEHSRFHCAAIRSRAYFAHGDFDSALAALVGEPDETIPSMTSEFNACRGLVLAGIGRYREARLVTSAAVDRSSNIETRVLAAGVHAICAVREEPSRAADAVRHLLTETRDSRNLDCFTTIYRGAPEIFGCAEPDVLLEASALLVNLGDSELASVVTHLGTQKQLGISLLSRRESEVGRLVAQGMTNKEIAAALFITPATAKLHVRHILEKLGVRTRTAAALKLAAAANVHATPESLSSD